MASGARDRIAVWPLAVGIGLPLLDMVLRGTPVGPDLVYVLVGSPLIYFLWFVGGIAAFWVFRRAAAAGAWRRATAAVLFPIALMIALADPIGFLRFTDGLSDRAHFEIMRAHYLAAVRARPIVDGKRVVVFNWGGMIWSSLGVIYDETDEIRLPPGKRSLAWWEQADRTEVACRGSIFEPVGRHFYLGYFPC